MLTINFTFFKHVYCFHKQVTQLYSFSTGKNENTGSENLNEWTMKCTIFWDVTPCSPVEVH
jgi:hypothetical protein